MKVYISSTFNDLAEHRSTAANVLRKLGHDVRGMETYVAESTRPAELCQRDAASADLVVLLIAWRYGYVPTGLERSVTELEYEAAVDAGRLVLAFIVPSEAPWPASRMDAITRENERERVEAFRARVSRDHIVATFTTPETLAAEVATAVRRAEASEQLSRRALRAANRTHFNNVRSGGDLSDTAAETVVQAVVLAADKEVVTIDIGSGDQWWSTRLYLLASLAADLTSIRQLLFIRTTDDLGDAGRSTSVIGLATPRAVRDRLRDAFPVLADFEAKRDQRGGIADVAAESRRRLAQWQEFFEARPRLRPQGEFGEQMWVREGLLHDWIGDYLIVGAIVVDPRAGLSVAQVQQILYWPWPYVPVVDTESRTKSAEPTKDVLSEQPETLFVVNRDDFARNIAHEWVAQELPRNRAM